MASKEDKKEKEKVDIEVDNITEKIKEIYKDKKINFNSDNKPK